MANFFLFEWEIKGCAIRIKRTYAKSISGYSGKGGRCCVSKGGGRTKGIFPAKYPSVEEDNQPSFSRTFFFRRGGGGAGGTAMNTNGDISRNAFFSEKDKGGVTC